MKITDFDFRIWDNSDMLYLENPALAIFTRQGSKGRIVDFIEAGNAGYNLDREVEINTYDESCLELELWCGAVDRKGEKIYCGDIIRNYDYKIDFLIKGREFGGMMIVPLGGSDLDMACALSNCEVIGNIHENPELLKGAK